MKAKSILPLAPLSSIAFSNSAAGPSFSSMRSATPALAQYWRAMAVYSSLMSKQVICASLPSARAIASEL